MRVVTLLGSLGSQSANAAALEVAAEHLRGRGSDVVAAGGLDQIPPFRSALVDEAPARIVGRAATVVEPYGIDPARFGDLA